MPKRTTWRSIAATFILLLTIAAFTNYFISHPEVRDLLTNTSWLLLLSLLGLYVLFVGSLALINSATLRLCGTRLEGRESLLLTMYSSVINFFGPLQSGPAFRALYLKKQHNINIKSYGTATLVYYGFYALFSGLFLLSGLLGFWLIPLFVIAVLALLYIRNSSRAFAKNLSKLDHTVWYYLAAATLLQVSLLAVIYYVELSSVLPNVSFSQVIVYTGAANFALFVSLTPGAIGFRETFLVFSQRLHHVSNDAIVVANTIDRAVYISLLLVVAVGIFATHAHKRLTAVTNNR